MEESSLIEKLYGNDFAERWNRFVSELLNYEQENSFFTKENPIGNFVIMNKDPQLFTVLFKTDLPEKIKNDLQNLADSYFKK